MGSRRMIEQDDQVWAAVEALAARRRVTLKALAREAFDDLLKKHGGRAFLREALAESAAAKDLPAKRRANAKPRRRK